jgi:hypothetical protein
MQVADAVMSCLEYHRANSEKKHGKWLSVRTWSVCTRIWSKKH